MKKKHYFDQMVDIMKTLRSAKGCSWDRKQTHQSLIKYLREEAREVELAIRKNDPDNLCEELGDLLLQVLFHAQIANEKKKFSIRDVVNGLRKKLIRRHPHVFGQKKIKSAEEVLQQWDQLKKREKELRKKDLQKKKRS